MSEQQRNIQITAKDLPLYCPNDTTELWCLHPRVYLDVAASGEVLCPYCGTKYQLKTGETDNGS